jgi:hypothetical protein
MKKNSPTPIGSSLIKNDIATSSSPTSTPETDPDPADMFLSSLVPDTNGDWKEVNIESIKALEERVEEKPESVDGAGVTDRQPSVSVIKSEINEQKRKRKAIEEEDHNRDVNQEGMKKRKVEEEI